MNWTTRTCFLLICCFGTCLWGATFSGQVMTAMAPPASGCVTPSSAPGFLTTENTAYLYFVATTTASETLTDKFIAPNGSVVSSGSWAANAGTFCFTGQYLNIGNLPSNELGAWTVEVFDDGALLFSIPFNVSVLPAISNAVATTQAPPSSGCATPPAVTSFYTSEGTVYLYFNAVATTADALTNDWLAPDGTSVSPGHWGAVYSCYFSSLSIASLPGSQLGIWKARVFDDGILLFTVSFTVTAGSPPANIPTISRVANGASFAQSFAPGMLMSVFGTGLSSGSPQTFSSAPLPVTSGTTSVTINGIAAPLLYVSSTQINLQLPYNVPAGNAALAVTVGGQTGTIGFSVQAAGPGIFVDSSNGYLVPNESATVGSTIGFFVTGVGLVNPAEPTGGVPVSGTTPIPTQPVTMTIGGIAITPVYAGIPSWSVGTLQINFTVPSTLPSGVQPVVVRIGGVSSQTAYLTVTPGASSSTGIQIISGNSQSTSTNTAFTSPLVVQVTNAQGSVVSGATVAWSVSSGSATLSSASTVTGSNGQTSITATAGASAGAITVAATSGSSKATFNLTAIAGVTGPLTITKVSSSSPTALTPLYISTSGLNMAQAFSVQLANTSGYSATLTPIRTQSDGTVVIAVPLYIVPTTGNTGPLTAQLTITQGRSTSAPVSLSIQDIPQNGSYGTSLGQLSYAFLTYQQLSLGRMQNGFQAIQTSPRNSVDTTTVQAHIATQLMNAVLARGDVAQIITNNSTQLGTGTLPSGASISFNSNSVQMMDRIAGMYLTAIQPEISTVQAAARRRVNARHRRPETDSLAQMSPEADPRLSFPPLLKTLGVIGAGEQIAAAVRTDMAADSTVADRLIASEAGAFAGLVIYGTVATTLGLPVIAGTVAAATTAGLIIGAVAIANDVYKIVTTPNNVLTESNAGGSASTLSSAISALKSPEGSLVLDISGYLLGGLAQIEGVPPSWGQSVATFLESSASASQGAVQSGALITSTLQLIATFPPGDSPSAASSDLTTAQNAASQFTLPFSSPEQGFGTVTGTVDITNSEGPILSGLSGIQIVDPSGTQFSDMADANGNYSVLVSLGNTSVAYSQMTLSAFDPISSLNDGYLFILSSAPIDLFGLTSTSPFHGPGLSGSCTDTDAGDPDSDDPDCDARRKKVNQ